VIIAWWDNRHQGDMYVQRIDGDGTPLWTADGVSIMTSGDPQSYIRVISDGSGIMHWSPNGISVCSAAGDQDNIVMTTDGAGGAIIAWDDTRTSEWEEIYAARITNPLTTGEETEHPTVAVLDQNHPNPFNPVTTISFFLSFPSNVSLRIYDTSGRLVRTILDTHRVAGRYEERWDGTDDGGLEVSSGAYFCRLTTGGRTMTKKMVLLR
jgi:hypothetical protein